MCKKCHNGREHCTRLRVSRRVNAYIIIFFTSTIFFLLRSGFKRVKRKGQRENESSLRFSGDLADRQTSVPE